MVTKNYKLKLQRKFVAVHVNNFLFCNWVKSKPMSIRPTYCFTICKFTW